MNAKNLRNSILQLAIQGKLVEQRKEEGTSKKLQEQIKVEKELLIKEKKIKREKPLPEILEDEKTFEIPESWEWVRLGNIVSIFGRIGYRGYTKEDIVNKGEGSITISPSNITSEGKTNFDNCTYISWDKYEESPEIMIYEGDIILVKTGSSYGKSAMVKGLPEKATINPQLVVLKNILCDTKYLDFTLKSNLAKNQYERFVIGTSIPTFSQAKLSSLVIPLPPLEEQKRIVAKIEELMPYVEEYDKAYSEVEELNKKFPEDMQKSILQYAIQGMLVGQREEEGTAEELYQQIQEEKEKLIKEGKINKQKPLPKITEEQIPFRIPDSWKWVRLGDITHNWGQKKPEKVFDYIDVGSIDNISGTLSKYENLIEAKDAPSRARKIVKEGTVLYSTVRPYLLNICIIDKQFKHEPIASTAFAVLHPYKGLFGRYLYYVLRSPMFIGYVSSVMIGVTYPAINDANLLAGLIPLPPLEEQKRIVAKIEELVPYTKQLAM